MNVGNQVWVASRDCVAPAWLVAMGDGFNRWAWVASNPTNGTLSRVFAALVYTTADDAVRATGLLSRLASVADISDGWFHADNPALFGRSPAHLFRGRLWDRLETMVHRLESGEPT